MDKKINPLVNPPDIVFKAALNLEQDVSFNEIRKWLDSCLSYSIRRIPYGKDDIELRWTQGQAQALSLILNPLSNPRQTLLAREKAASENALPRNV